MSGSDREFHAKRAEKERIRADRSTEPYIRRMHDALARLHQARAEDEDRRLRIVADR